MSQLKTTTDLMCLFCVLCIYQLAGRVILKFPHLGQEVRIYYHTYMCLTKNKTIQGHSRMSRLTKSIVHDRVGYSRIRFAGPSLLVEDILDNEGSFERCIYCVFTPQLEKHCWVEMDSEWAFFSGQFRLQTNDQCLCPFTCS